MASILLENVHKVYPNGHLAAAGLDLAIDDGEFVVLVGPSGSGKSTALRIVAGLETPTSGRILIGDDDVTGVSPQQRDLAMVFQSYALYPHKTVRQNLAFPLRMQRMSKDEIARRVDVAARKLGLGELLDRKPAQLSGGQRQRVALGRAIVREPRAFLLDEPLSNLDARLRVQTRAELARLHRDLAATMLYVTHDQEEALTLGDRIAVMDQGRLQQVAPPMEVYRRPINVFVAGFIGSPAMNLFRCTVEGDGGDARLVGEAVQIPLAETGLEKLREGDAADVVLGVRPHDVEPAPAEQADVAARIDVIEPLGSELLVHALPITDEQRAHDGSAASITIVAPGEATLAVDEIIGLRFRRERLHLFDAADGRRVN